jgi:hypothetical protein
LVVKSVEEYLQYAEECRRLTSRARSLDEKEAILMIAESWENLAKVRQRKITKERRLPKAT